MKVIHMTYPYPFEQETFPETVAAIGFFDGIHKGHQKLIQRSVAYANKHGMESAVITFLPHPSVVLKGLSEEAVKYITPLKEKKEVLEQFNIDRVYIVTFNKDLSRLSPKEFVEHFIIGLNIKHLIGGFDYSFGFKGQGNMNNIHQFANGLFTYEIVDRIDWGGEKISSTRIRKCLQEGDMVTTNVLLGRPYFNYGTVIEGDKRGRTIGFPTANIKTDATALLPKTGVYAVKVHVPGKSTDFLGMANLGTKPTFTKGEENISLEVNILDFSGDLYGQTLKIEWYKHVRDEIKFSGVDSLVEQIKKDEQTIRSYFEKHRNL